MWMTPQCRTDILSSTIAHNAIPYFDLRPIFSAESYPACIAIDKSCIKKPAISVSKLICIVELMSKSKSKKVTRELENLNYTV